MADEQRQSWWRSVPGTLTAASGFIAALSGLVAGLNQLGVFRREPPAAQQVVGTAPAPRESTPNPPSPSAGGAASSTAPAPTTTTARPTPPPPASPSSGASTRATSPSKPAPSGAPRPASDTVKVVDTTAATPVRLPKGTSLELVVPARVCAPADGQRRFTARLATPVKVGAATVLPANTTAVLQVRRAGSPAAPQVRLDSLGREQNAVAVPQSRARLRPDAANGTCLRANARIIVTLDSPVVLRGR